MARRIRKSRAQLKYWNELISAVKLMNFALNNVSIYPPTHTELRDVVERFHAQMQPMFEEQEDLGFGYMDEVLYIEGAMSIEETRNNEMLIERMKFCRLKYLTFMKGATVDELLKFFIIVNDASKSFKHPPIPELLDKGGVDTISVVEAAPDEEAGKTGARRKTLFDWYEKVLVSLRRYHKLVLDDPKADLRPIYRLADDMMATIRTKGHEPFLLLPFLSKGQDPYMAHSVNVAIYCGTLGYHYGLNAGLIQTLCVAAFLHDVGRVIIPVDWARARTRLSLFERAVVSQHPAWSFLLLMRNPDLSAAIPLASFHHHDNPQRASKTTGYTSDTLQKILNVADAYDLAAFNDRIYWKKMRTDRMLKCILARRGSFYDPTIAKALSQLIGYYPIGTVVRLSDGQRGIVVRNDATHVARPVVYLFEAPPPTEPEKPPAATGIAPDENIGPRPALADLMELDEGGLKFKRSVVGCIDASSEGIDVGALLAAQKEHLLDAHLLD